MNKDFLDPAELKRVEESRKKELREQSLRISDMRKVLSTAEGRRLIWRVLEKCKVMADAFSLNSLEMARFQGERSVGISLLEDLVKAKPEVFYQMFCEAKSKENSAKVKEEENGS